MDELPDVDHDRPLPVEEAPDPLSGVAVVRAGVVGGRYLRNALASSVALPELLRACCSDERWSGLRPGPPFSFSTTPRSKASGLNRSVSTPPGSALILSVRSGSPRLPCRRCGRRGPESPWRPPGLSGEAHVLLAPAGEVLQAASVDDAHVVDAAVLQGTAYYQRSWHGVVGDHALRFGYRENAPRHRRCARGNCPVPPGSGPGRS